MQAGKLRHRVTIEQPTETQDAYGSVVQSWATLATVWAAIEPVTGRERFATTGDVRYAENEVHIRIRYRDDITPKMRVVHGSDVYNIRAVMDRWGRGQELLLRCTVAE